MPSIHSPNFAFMEAHDPLLVRLAAQAERYLFDDPNTAIIKARKFIEALARLFSARVRDALTAAGFDVLLSK